MGDVLIRREKKERVEDKKRWDIERSLYMSRKLEPTLH